MNLLSVFPTAAGCVGCWGGLHEVAGPRVRGHCCLWPRMLPPLGRLSISPPLPITPQVSKLSNDILARVLPEGVKV